MDASVVLRAGAALLAGVTFFGAGRFVLEHPKNPDAPLQPPAAQNVAVRSSAPASSAAPASSTAPAPTALPRASQPRGTPPPQITLQPGVRATALPGITYTHVS